MFSLTRISTQSLQQSPISDMISTQSKLGDIQRQISSGVAIHSFAELSAQHKTSFVLDVNHHLEEVNAYLHSNKLIETRLNTMNTATSTIIDTASSLLSLITQRNNPAVANALPVQQLADSYLSSIEGSLNAQVEGRYVFAGSRTNTAPVTTLLNSNLTYDVGSNSYGGTANYYKGDNVTMKSYVSDHQEVSYGITANNDAFQKIIAAAHMLKTGDLNNDEAMLRQANDLANEAIKDLSTVQAQINSNISIMNNNNQSHEDYKIFLKNAKSEALDTDIGEASIKLANYQANLQAMFLAVSRIGSLKLSDFLS